MPIYEESDGTYRLKYKKCGKARCRLCSAGGSGHGPYWFHYHNGREEYIGVQLPASLQHYGRLHHSSFVGRQQEMTQLQMTVEAIERLRKKHPARRQKKLTIHTFEQAQAQTILLSGEAGLGKTRLAEEVAHTVLQRGWIVLWGRAYEQEGVIPYRIWIDVLRTALLLQPEYQNKMNQALQPYQPLNTLLLELREFFPLLDPPEGDQVPLWDAAYSLLTALSEKKPVLIVLDDLQWADRSSRDLLAYLARRASSSALLILGTYRADSGQLDVLFHEMHSEGHTALLPVPPLNNEYIGELVSSSATLSQAQLQFIQSWAQGNPFFAEELAREVNTVQAEQETDQTLGSLPKSITVLLEQRLEGISPACHTLLRNGAVLGGSFSFPLIHAMEATEESDSESEEHVLSLVEEALSARILTEEGVGKNVTYHFWHPLLAHLLYEHLSAYRRANLHRRAAKVLLSHYTDREREMAAAISHHLLMGGADAQLIVQYAKMAGDRAYYLSAYNEAEKHYRISLEYSPKKEVQFSPEQTIELFENLGECLRIQGEAQEARAYYERAIALHLSRYKEAEASEREHIAQVLALLYCERGLTWYDTSGAQQAMSSYSEGEHILIETNVSGGYAWGRILYEESYVRWREGNYEEAFRLAQRTLELFTQAANEQRLETAAFSLPNRTRRTLAGDATDIGRTHMLLGLIANGMGQTKEALHHLTLALTLFEQGNRQREIANVCCNLGDLYLRKADHPRAQSMLQRALSLAQSMGDSPLVGFTSGNIGILELRRGQLVDAEKTFRQAIRLTAQTGDRASMGLWSTYLARTLYEQGRLDEAGSVLLESLTVLHQVHITPYIGFALISVGLLRLSRAVFTALAGTGDATRKITRCLQQARKSLDHALSLAGIEEEMRLEGQLTVGRIALLQMQEGEVLLRASQTLEDAERAELPGLTAQAQCLKAELLALQGQRENAFQAFEEASQAFQAHEMRLEYARTRFKQAHAMLRLENLDSLVRTDTSSRWHTVLGEMQQIFNECHASLDLQLAEHSASC